MTAAALAALVVFDGGAVGAANQDGQTTGGYNAGGSIGAEAAQTTRAPGAPGASSSRGRSGPAVDYEARYHSLASTLALEQLREVDRRASEAAYDRDLRARHAACRGAAAHYRSIAYDRVRVVERVPQTRTVTAYERIPYYENVRVPVTVYEHIPYYEDVRVPVTVHDRIPIVEHYRVWVRRGWRWVLEHRTRVTWVVRARTVYRTERVLRWRVEARTTYRVERRLSWRVEARTVTFTAWHTVERWETRLVNPVAVALAIAYDACADNAAAALRAHEDRVGERRDAWNAGWARLNEQAHDAWRAFNTTCTTGPRQGDFAEQVCSYGAWRNFSPGSSARTIRVVPARPAVELIRQARDEVTPPAPVIRLNPRAEWEQIVRLPTWMWLEGGAWATQRARAEAGEAWAEATAVPRQVVWDMGNGDRVTCDGPGTPYDPGAVATCSYTYRRSSAGQPNDAYTVTATVLYEVSWTGSGATGGDLGTLTTTDTERVRVAELQALINP